MIPKKIHYVWVGGQPKPKAIQRCMKTWKKHLQDYQIIEWNEENFDFSSNPFAQAAYKAKKWAYVSDYIRAYVIYHEGGIYLDTDVRVLDRLDPLLNDKAFIGFENNEYLSAAIFGAEKGHPLMKDILDYYDQKNFTFDSNNQLAGVNSLSVTEIVTKNYGLKLGNFDQNLNQGLHVYNDGVLCNPSGSSKTIHLFTGTWMNGRHSLKQKIVTTLKRHISNPTEAKIYQKLIR